MKKVTVDMWETTDGKQFKNEGLADIHERKVKERNIRDNTFAVNQSYIRNYIFTNRKDDLKDPNMKRMDLGFNHVGHHGWKCKNKDNPIDVCIYSYDTWYGDDSCVFCGEPEERK